MENLHLARYGYFSLGVFEKRYAFAGFWALAPILLFFLFDRLAEEAAELRRKQRGSTPRPFLWWVISLLGMSASIYAIQYALAQLLGVPVSWWHWLAFINGGGILVMLMTRGAYLEWSRLTEQGLLHASPGKPANKDFGTLVRIVLGKVQWVWSPLVVTYLVFFTYILFPEIPAYWGGGGAEKVQLFSSYDTAAGLASLGVTRETSQLSRPITLVATTSDDYVVLVDSVRVLYVKRDLVHAVAVSGRFGVPRVTRQTVGN